jgi:hypothetical protein
MRFGPGPPKVLKPEPKLVEKESSAKEKGRAGEILRKGIVKGTRENLMTNPKCHANSSILEMAIASGETTAVTVMKRKGAKEKPLLSCQRRRRKRPSKKLRLWWSRT